MEMKGRQQEISSINHFDNRQDARMENGSLGGVGRVSGRKRSIPQKYMEGIRELKRVDERWIQNIGRQSNENCTLSWGDSSPEKAKATPRTSEPNHDLFCLLPSGRRLFISIVAQNSNKKPIKKQPLSRIETPAPSVSLLDTFLLAFEKLQASPAQPEIPSPRPEPTFSDQPVPKDLPLRLRKQSDDQEKYSLFAHHYRSLQKRLDKTSSQSIAL